MSPRSDYPCAPDPAPPLLGDGDPPPLDRLNAEGRAPLLLVCDHASRRVPAALGRLGLDEAASALHIASDIGAAGVTRRLSARLDAAALLAGYSRLVIDLNRGLDQPTLIAESSDGIAIPGNCGLTPGARSARIEALYRPWHRAVASELRRLDGRGGGAPAILLGIHSFTPEMNGRARPWQVGVLWDDPCRLARPLMAALAGQGLTVGDNEPYTARNPSGGTLETHGLQTGRPGVSVEIRQDLIADAAGQAAWAGRLAAALRDLLCPT
ncbi:MAG: N-formylglutamate amidohydrolase [Rhodospirillaceae bacterium]